MSQRNSARRIQQPGSKCSNPKPSPHKKPNWAPGESRFRTENEPRYWDRWLAWNHRRKPKLPNRDSPPSRDCITEAYEKIPAECIGIIWLLWIRSGKLTKHGIHGGGRVSWIRDSEYELRMILEQTLMRRMI
jgi:hypothetical protein